MEYLEHKWSLKDWSYGVPQWIHKNVFCFAKEQVEKEQAVICIRKFKEEIMYSTDNWYLHTNYTGYRAYLELRGTYQKNWGA